MNCDLPTLIISTHGIYRNMDEFKNPLNVINISATNCIVANYSALDVLNRAHILCSKRVSKRVSKPGEGISSLTTAISLAQELQHLNFKGRSRMLNRPIKIDVDKISAVNAAQDELKGIEKSNQIEGFNYIANTRAGNTYMVGHNNNRTLLNKSFEIYRSEFYIPHTESIPEESLVNIENIYENRIMFYIPGQPEPIDLLPHWGPTYNGCIHFNTGRVESGRRLKKSSSEYIITLEEILIKVKQILDSTTGLSSIHDVLIVDFSCNLIDNPYMSYKRSIARTWRELWGPNKSKKTQFKIPYYKKNCK